MGVRGARSLMDADPDRYCETFTWNYEPEEGKLALLVDGMSVLYHVAVRPDNMVYASPATIRECISVYVQNLQLVVGNQGSIHIFLDGLSPKEKIPAQIERMKQQAISGDELARGQVLGKNRTKVLHHLADWAYVEAIASLSVVRPNQINNFNNLHLHRARMGEGEAYINQWISKNASDYAKIGIISEDSDFLVYESCPGFIPPSTIKIEELSGRYCFQGKHYLRSKFIKSFLLGETKDLTVMTAVAGIAGCDYTLEQHEELLLRNLRSALVRSDMGGIRKKVRNNPTAAAVLTAILRVVAYFQTNHQPDTWLEQMMLTFVPVDAIVPYKALRKIHDIYTHFLEISANPAADINPGMVEARRLLQYGIFYCHPLVESWEKGDISEKKKRPRISKGSTSQTERYTACEVHAHPVVPLPPLTTQIAVWIDRTSVWFMPHFRQVRARLYSLLKLLAAHGRVPADVADLDFWTNKNVTIEEAVRIGTGSAFNMERFKVVVPEFYFLSYGFGPEDLLKPKDTAQAMDRALMFCIMGAPQQLGLLQLQAALSHGTVFLASLMLPFNLACLLILMATAPPLNNLKLTAAGAGAATATEACNEVNDILPCLSVACSHALMLVNTFSLLFEPKMTSLASRPMNVSETFRHDNALLIWRCLRLGRNLEYLPNQDSFSPEDEENVRAYLEIAFIKLGDILLHPGPDNQRILNDWKGRALPLWLVWWDIFSLEVEGLEREKKEGSEDQRY